MTVLPNRGSLPSIWIEGIINWINCKLSTHHRLPSLHNAKVCARQALAFVRWKTFSCPFDRTFFEISSMIVGCNEEPSWSHIFSIARNWVSIVIFLPDDQHVFMNWRKNYIVEVCQLSKRTYKKSCILMCNLTPLLFKINPKAINWKKNSYILLLKNYLYAL